MKRFTSNANLQEECCRTLINLAYYPSTRQPILMAGGVAAVLAAMEAHPASASIASSGCNTLHHFALEPSNLPHLGQAPIIALVGDAMRQHRTYRDLQHGACKFLLNLDPSVYAAHPALGLDDAWDALGRYAGEYHVQELWCTWLCEQNPTILQQARLLGVPPLVEAARAKWPEYLENICTQLLGMMDVTF